MKEEEEVKKMISFPELILSSSKEEIKILEDKMNIKDIQNGGENILLGNHKMLDDLIKSEKWKEIILLEENSSSINDKYNLLFAKVEIH